MRYGSIGGLDSRVRSPQVQVVLSVYQRGSLLGGLAMYLSCDTKKFHDNESTHILHNFWTSTHRGKLPLPPGGATAYTHYADGTERLTTQRDVHTFRQSLLYARTPFFSF